MTQLPPTRMRGEPSGRVRAKVQIELAGQFMLGAPDIQAADGPPSGLNPGQQVGPEADLRVGHGVQEAGPGQQSVQQR
jgi:hypothetical protein